MVIFLAFSGGIDSTFCSFLLKKLCVNLCLLYFICYYNFYLSKCVFYSDLVSVYLLSRLLHLKVYVFNLIDLFMYKVVNPLLKGINKGLTYNPDIFCNIFIKLPSLIKLICIYKNSFCGFGHYVNKIDDNIYFSDPQKDQSFFIYYSLIYYNRFLSRILFPIGNHLKINVLFLMEFFCFNFILKFVSSRGICFIGDVSFVRFISVFVKSVVCIFAFNIYKFFYKNLYMLTLGQCNLIKGFIKTFLYMKVNYELFFVLRNSTLLLKRIICGFYFGLGMLFCFYYVRLFSSSGVFIKCVCLFLSGYVYLNFLNPINTVSSGQYIIVYNLFFKCVGVILVIK